MAARRRPNFCQRLALVATLALGGLATPAQAADSLATPITAELQQALWPVSVAVEIVALDDAEPEPAMLLPTRAITVPDGHLVSFSSAVWTPRGRRNFTVDVVARQHPREQMEIEWDLVVEDAPYQTVSVGDYLLHRLRFGPRPELDTPRVRVSRADIVTTRGEPHVESVTIDGSNYEIRIFALSVRG